MDSRIMLTKSSYIMLWQARIHIHFVVLMEPQSSENCTFFVLASGHKYNKMNVNPHTKVSMHARDQMMEKSKPYFFSITYEETIVVKRQ